MYNKKQNDKKDNFIRIAIIIIIIIIILLLLHCCSSKKGNKDDGNTIYLCTDEDNNPIPCTPELLVNCMEDVKNQTCRIPDFRGMTEEDVYKWLSKISNNIDLTFKVYDSNEQDGIIIDQSNEKNMTVKDLLDNNLPLIISFANSRDKKVDCITNPNSENCIVPDFTGKTKNDVYEWLSKISNDINTTFSEIKSEENNGKIVKQSVKSGTKVKDLIENNESLDIYFSNNEKIDCLKDDTNPVCIVPNFTGSTQKEIDEWLESISNSVTLNYKNTESDLKSKTVISQSVKPGTSIKDLIKNNIPLTIEFATNKTDDRVDCLKDYSNPKCTLPDFKGMTKEDVDKWLASISNSIPIKYEKVSSNDKIGNITNQSIASGTNVRDILNNNQELVISISKRIPLTPGNIIKPTDNSNNNQNVEPTPEPTPDPEPDPIPEEEQGEVIVKDSSVTWETDTVVDIFTNSLANDKIAPESSNTYQFSVNNNTTTNVKYTMTFDETNDSQINMKYKLRKNNSYIVSEYTSISDLNLSEQILNSNKSDVFYLEWKWVSSDNDTDIGASRTATYNLKIKVEAEEIG